MSYDVIASSPVCKHGAHLILGNRLPPERAIELIRISDSFFWSARAETDYELNVKRLLGVPLLADYDRFLPDGQFDNTDMRGLEHAQIIFRRRWGAVPWEFLGCAQVGHATGWCYPDGTIARTGELDGWVYPNQMWEECEALAKIFPDIAISVAVWGKEHIFDNGMMMHEAPEGPWNEEMRAAIRPPSHGLVVGGGRVEGVHGDDPTLFGGYGYTSYVDAIEGTFRQHRRLNGQGIAESEFGDRTARDGSNQDRPGLSDAVIESWIRVAQQHGLVVA